MPQQLIVRYRAQHLARLVIRQATGLLDAHQQIQQVIPGCVIAGHPRPHRLVHDLDKVVADVRGEDAHGQAADDVRVGDDKVHEEDAVVAAKRLEHPVGNVHQRVVLLAQSGRVHAKDGRADGVTDVAHEEIAHVNRGGWVVGKLIHKGD